MFIASVILSCHLILWWPLLLLSSIFPSIRDFSNELALCIRWPKYWSFNFNISPFSEYSGLFSLKINWLDLLAVQGAFRNLLQHYSSKASILWHYAFFMFQLSQTYMTTRKTISLTIGNFFSRVMSLLFNKLSRSVIAFLPRSNRPLISWLQAPSTVTLEPKKRKSVTTSTFPPIFASSHWVECHDLRLVLIFSLKYALSLHGKMMGKQWLTLFLGAPKSLHMVIAAIKLKDTYSLEGKL